MNKPSEQQMHEIIEQSYQRQQDAILDSLPVIIFLLDEDGKYLEVMTGEHNQLYRTKDELLGKHLHDVFDKNTADEFLEAIHNTLAQDKVNKLEYSLDVIKGLTHFSGRISTMNYRVDGRRVVLFVAIDVTEQKKKDIQLQHSIKMEAVGQLTGGLAHDFNNLLSIIIGNLDCLRDSTRGEAESQVFIDRAVNATSRGSALIKQLLMFARHQQCEVMPVDINTIINMMDALIAHTIPHDVRVSHNLQENLWSTRVAPGEFENVLLNLISNAHEAMPDGGTLTIETRNIRLDEEQIQGICECAAGEYILLSITDTGSGMPSEISDKAFEPFFTTREVGKGRGLGLSIVYGFMQSVSGCVAIESEAGKGTTLHLYLPRNRDTADTANERTHTPASSETSPSNTRTILVVDDEVDLLVLAQEQIEDLGYKVYGASSGQQALQLLADHEDIDLMFSDVIMPDDLTGYELAIKAMEIRPALKILLASGFTTEVMEQKGLALFEAKILHKPYRYEELSTKLREVLRNL